MFAEGRSRKRFLLAFGLFVLSAISYLDRTNISIAGLQISSEFGLGNQRLGYIFSAFLIGYAGFATFSDVQVHTARVLDLLHLDMEVIRGGVEEAVTRVFRAGRGLQRVTERLAPETGCLIEIVRMAVDDETGESALVHGESSVSGRIGAPF